MEIMEYGDFKPCMFDRECVDRGRICLQSLEDRVNYNNFVDQHNLPEELKFDIYILPSDIQGIIDIGFGNVPF